MFNYHQHLRQQQKAELSTRQKELMEKLQAQQKAGSEKMCLNYQRKVQNFLFAMKDSPVVLNNFTSSDFKFRQEDKGLLVGDSNFYVKGYKHEKDRIREAIQANAYLTLEPSPHPKLHCFRERDVRKERLLHEDHLRFKARSSVYRVKEYLRNNTQGQVENLDYKVNLPPSELKSLGNIERRELEAKFIARRLLPSLHKKTYFQGACAISNGLPLGGVSRGEKKEIAARDTSQVDKQAEARQNMANHVKQILEKCNFVQSRNENVKRLRKGSGHLMCSVDKPVGKLYEQLQRWRGRQRTMSLG